MPILNFQKQKMDTSRICAILSQFSPVPSLHRSFNIGQPKIVSKSSEVRCLIPSSKHFNLSQPPIVIFRRDCRPPQISSGKGSSSLQQEIFRCSKARLKGSFGNSFNFRKPLTLKYSRQVRFLNIPFGKEVIPSLLSRSREVRP